MLESCPDLLVIQQPEEIIRRCPLCKREKFVSYGQVFEFNYPWQYQICVFCGLVIQNPQMTTAQMQKFYAQQYWALHGHFTHPNQTELTFQARRIENLLSIIPAQFPSPRLFLDIGCSTGASLEIAKRKFGCEVRGIEPNQPFRDYCNSKGWIVYETLESYLANGEPPADLICMSHVLEHIKSPVEYLSRLRNEQLSPDGFLLVEIPNVHAHGSFEMAHVVCFSQKTLTETLAQAGFKIISIKVHNVPREEKKRPLYLSAFCAVAQPKPKAAIQRVWLIAERWKRRFGLIEGHFFYKIYFSVRQAFGEYLRKWFG